MCFKKDNTNFVRIKLNSEMKGLSDTEKQRKYQIIKDDVRKRLYNSYINCHQKLEFYSEIFEVLGLYDVEYVVYNLFFEHNAEQIINTLLEQKKFQELNVNFQRNDTLAYDFYYYIANKSYFMKLEFHDFLRDKTFDIIQTISRQQWTNNNQNIHPVVNKYATFLTQVNYQNIELTVYGFFLFVKIWNFINVYSKPFNNTKAIILYNKFINFFNENENDYGFFYYFFMQLENVFNSFFVRPNYLPLLDKKDCDFYSNGYIKKRKQFFNLIKFQGKINSISSQMSYIELIEICDDNFDYLVEFFETYDNYLIEIIELNISKKINSFCYPDSNELLLLRNLRKGNSLLSYVLDKLFQRFYLY